MKTNAHPVAGLLPVRNFPLDSGLSDGKFFFGLFMNKTQVIWLIIRLAGVYFAFLLVTAFFGLLGSIPALYTLPKLDLPNKNSNVSTPGAVRSSGFPSNPTNPTNPTYDVSDDPSQPNSAKTDEESVTAKFKGENFTNFLWFLVMTGIYGALTWYTLRDGRLLFDVLNRERPDGVEMAREPEVTSLNLSDKD